MKTQTVKTRKVYRQGELLFMPVHPEEMQTLGIDSTGSPHPSWHKLATPVIREGEATGHKHEVIERTAGTAVLHEPKRLFLFGLAGMGMIESEDRMLVVKEPVDIVHPEHRPLTLPSGFYLIIIQREYDEIKSRRILD